LRYIQGTRHYGLHLYPSSIASLILYTYVDWGGYPDTSRSTSGYCVFLGDNPCCLVPVQRLNTEVLLM
jgi:hypothetical protein